jgi:hypothetical protein
MQQNGKPCFLLIDEINGGKVDRAVNGEHIPLSLHRFSPASHIITITAIVAVIVYRVCL